MLLRLAYLTATVPVAGHRCGWPVRRHRANRHAQALSAVWAAGSADTSMKAWQSGPAPRQCWRRSASGAERVRTHPGHGPPSRAAARFVSAVRHHRCMNSTHDASGSTLSPHEVLALAFAEHDFTQNHAGTQLHIQTSEPSVDRATTYIEATVTNWADDDTESVTYRYRIEHQLE